MTNSHSPPPVRRALLVEDDEGVRRSLQLLLHWRGFEVRSFAAAGPLLSTAAIAPEDILIADYRLPDGTGIDVARALRARGWAGRSILITGFPHADLSETAAANGFAAVLEKPLRPHLLVAALMDGATSV